MTFKLYLFALLLVISGAQRLWVHFADLGIPTSLGEVINSQVLLGLFGLSVGLGLIRRRPLAHTTALAIVFLGIIGAPLVIAYLFFAGGSGAFLFLVHFISYISPTMASDFTRLMGTLGVGLLFYFLLCWVFLRDLLSKRLREEFDEDLWFNQELILGPINLKVLVMMGLIILFSYFDNVVPEEFHRKLNDKHTQQAIEYFQQLPEVQERVARSKAEQEQRREISRGVVWCQFSADERTLFLTASDGSIHRLNLATGQTEVSELVSDSHLRRRYQGGEFMLGPDGDTYYEAKTKSLRKASDPDFEFKLPSPRSHRFLTFGSSATEILLFNSETQSFEKWFVGAKEPLWQRVAPFEQIQDWGYLWQSATLNWLYVAGRKAGADAPIHSLIRLDTGQIQTLPIEFRFREFGWSDPLGRWIALSGPVAFDQHYNTYRVDLPSQTVQQIADLKPSGALWESALWQSHDLREVEPQSAGQSVPQWARSLSGIRHYSVVGGGRWAVFLQNGRKHTSLFDLSNQEEQLVLGEIFADETIGSNPVCLTTTRSQSLVAVVIGRQLQVFWVSEFGKASPASFLTTLELEPSIR